MSKSSTPTGWFRCLQWAGEAVTERWAHARTFYVVLDGELTVTVDGVEVNHLGAGASFGEIAAIDWGRDFSYGRTATVTTTTPARLLAIPGAALRELKENAATRAIPVFVTSILDNKPLAFRLGAADYLRKPVSPDQIPPTYPTQGQSQSAISPSTPGHGCRKCPTIPRLLPKPSGKSAS